MIRSRPTSSLGFYDPLSLFCRDEASTSPDNIFAYADATMVSVKSEEEIRTWWNQAGKVMPIVGRAWRALQKGGYGFYVSPQSLQEGIDEGDASLPPTKTEKIFHHPKEEPVVSKLGDLLFYGAEALIQQQFPDLVNPQSPIEEQLAQRSLYLALQKTVRFQAEAELFSLPQTATFLISGNAGFGFWSDYRHFHILRTRGLLRLAEHILEQLCGSLKQSSSKFFSEAKTKLYELFMTLTWASDKKYEVTVANRTITSLDHMADLVVSYDRGHYLKTPVPALSRKERQHIQACLNRRLHSAREVKALLKALCMAAPALMKRLLPEWNNLVPTDGEGPVHVPIFLSGGSWQGPDHVHSDDIALINILDFTVPYDSRLYLRRGVRGVQAVEAILRFLTLRQLPFKIVDEEYSLQELIEEKAEDSLHDLAIHRLTLAELWILSAFMEFAHESHAAGQELEFTVPPDLEDLMPRWGIFHLAQHPQIFWNKETQAYLKETIAQFVEEELGEKKDDSNPASHDVSDVEGPVLDEIDDSDTVWQ